jgi:hypothetical protein
VRRDSVPCDVIRELFPSDLRLPTDSASVVLSFSDEEIVDVQSVFADPVPQQHSARRKFYFADRTGF